mmetsp:Transcript_22455/g.34084  ORF Transcript_22455/g.34084 Transcript_22455/m.34084 type:complete len:351 (-) Transcript_22455:175-1227(-)
MPSHSFSLKRFLIVASLTLSWKNGDCCLARASSDASPTTAGGVPKSERQEEYSKDELQKLWNPSSQILDNGFLSKIYHRVPGVFEQEEGGGEVIEGIHHHSRLINNPVRCRQVPGDGNCLFHSLVVCKHWAENESHYSYQDYDELRRESRKLREEAINYLSKKPNRRLYTQGDEYWLAQEMIEAAAEPFNVTAREYCEQMRQEFYWGGGPEVVALCNLLRRPIHIYELCPGARKREFRFRRYACFGSPRFDRKEALHILSADSRFPDLTPGSQLANGNHFLALIPEAMTSKRQRKKRVRVRGGNKKEQQYRKETITPDARSFSDILLQLFKEVKDGIFISRDICFDAPLC